jgi:hypothetical protein
MQKGRQQQTPQKSIKSSETTLRTYKFENLEEMNKFLDT